MVRPGPPPDASRSGRGARSITATPQPTGGTLLDGVQGATSRTFSWRISSRPCRRTDRKGSSRSPPTGRVIGSTSPTRGSRCSDPMVAGRRRLGEILCNAGLTTRRGRRGGPAHPGPQHAGISARSWWSRARSPTSSCCPFSSCRWRRSSTACSESAVASSNSRKGPTSTRRCPRSFRSTSTASCSKLPRRLDEWNLIERNDPQPAAHLRRGGLVRGHRRGGDPGGSRAWTANATSRTLPTILLCSPFAVAKIMARLLETGRAYERPSATS